MKKDIKKSKKKKMKKEDQTKKIVEHGVDYYKKAN